MASLVGRKNPPNNGMKPILIEILQNWVGSKEQSMFTALEPYGHGIKRLPQ